MHLQEVIEVVTPAKAGVQNCMEMLLGEIYREMTFFCQEDDGKHPKASVVVVTQTPAVDKTRLLEKIGK